MAMQTRVEVLSSSRIDLGTVRRTVRTKKSRILQLSRLARTPSPVHTFNGRPSRKLWAHPSPLRMRHMLISASATNVAQSVSDSTEKERDLGWSRKFSEKFDLEDDILGEGSFGIVRSAISKENGNRYAVKLLPKHAQGEWERYSALLEREVTHWQQLQDCSDVAHLEGVYEDHDHLYIVQELCSGGDIQHFIHEHGKLSEYEAAQIITPMLRMLAACHGKNICFGDVKPANFMLKKPYPSEKYQNDHSAPKGDIIVKGIDFGCSQKISDDEKLKKRTGTPLYMAPEIFFGWYSMEVDVWATGMMLYQLIAGKLPFFGDHAEQLKKGPTFMIVQAVMESDLEFSGKAWDDVSSELKDLIRGLLDVDYNTRLTAKLALQHPWIKMNSKDNVIVKGPFGNIIKFHGPETPVVRSGGNGDSEDDNGGRED